MERLDREVLRGWALGYNAAEIGDKLNISAAAVRQRKKRALEKLRARLLN